MGTLASGTETSVPLRLAPWQGVLGANHGLLARHLLTAISGGAGWDWGNWNLALCGVRV